MERNDYYKIGILLFLPVLIFFPVLNSTYFYTDEIVQLWLYRKGSNFAMFVGQGRVFNDWLFRQMFSHIDTISQLTRLHLFALTGWILCLPVWYMVFFRVSKDEGLSSQLPFFAVFFLVCSLPFGISIQWASCMELFIAYTCGLLSGYLVYRYERRGWLPALLLGVTALAFYQNGFGCYLLPFFLRLIARQKADRKMLAPLAVYLAIYAVYYLLFIAAENFVFHSGITARAALETNPLHKAYFLLLKALPQAFYFNLVVQEYNDIARLLYILALGGCLWLNYRSGIARNYWLYLALLFGGFALVYLPSVIIKENFASNRTLLALDMAVFCWVAVTLMRSIRQERLRRALPAILGLAMGLLAIYNFRNVFLRPAVDEYTALKQAIDQGYRPEVNSVDYIRSPEYLVRNKYGVHSSWDEYGFSSSYFSWVPDAVTRQLVFEKTGDRALAEKLNIRVWVSRQAFEASGRHGGPGTLLIDAPAILMSGTAPSK